jgi:hypothetical protein
MGAPAPWKIQTPFDSGTGVARPAWATQSTRSPLLSDTPSMMLLEGTGRLEPSTAIAPAATALTALQDAIQTSPPLST